MTPYITKIIDAFPEKITGIAFSPAADHLFHVHPSSDAKLLPEIQACAYHYTTAQLFSFHVFVTISKQLLLFSLLALMDQMEMTGAN